MNITEYKLVLTYDNDRKKEIIYRGNEDIIIKHHGKFIDIQDTLSIYVPRHILTKFIEIIE